MARSLPNTEPGGDIQIMDEITIYVAQVALWLAAQPPEALRSDPQTLDTVEQMARRILNEVAAIRMSRPAGETRGMWRVVQSGRP